MLRALKWVVRLYWRASDLEPVNFLLAVTSGGFMIAALIAAGVYAAGGDFRQAVDCLFWLCVAGGCLVAELWLLGVIAEIIREVLDER
ncbi:MAG: hypothetical protein ACOX7B_11820 [Christensenellales bacterium]|jgi:hypothetical protein